VFDDIATTLNGATNPTQDADKRAPWSVVLEGDISVTKND